MSKNRIVIKNATSTPRVIKRKDGTQVIFNEQKAAIEKGEDFPIPFVISLGDGQPPFAAGEYILDPACLEVGDFGSLRVARRIQLIPAPTAPAK